MKNMDGPDIGQFSFNAIREMQRKCTGDSWKEENTSNLDWKNLHGIDSHLFGP